MALTPSTMLPLGTPAPDFSLPDTNGNLVSLSQFEGAKGLVVVFMCNHCPYVKHIRGGLAQFARDMQEKGVGVVGISSNNVETHPADSPELMKKEQEEAGYDFPYLYDESQEVAKAYKAACTPDFYLFDSGFKLVYRGQFDDSRPNTDISVTGKSLRAAVGALLKGDPISEDQNPSIGCNIKWKPGNEPEYF